MRPGQDSQGTEESAGFGMNFNNGGCDASLGSIRHHKKTAGFHPPLLFQSFFLILTTWLTPGMASIS